MEQINRTSRPVIHEIDTHNTAAQQLDLDADRLMLVCIYGVVHPIDLTPFKDPDCTSMAVDRRDENGEHSITLRKVWTGNKVYVVVDPFNRQFKKAS